MDGSLTSHFEVLSKLFMDEICPVRQYSAEKLDVLYIGNIAFSRQCHSRDKNYLFFWTYFLSEQTSMRGLLNAKTTRSEYRSA